jgi:hypothetical protein
MYRMISALVLVDRSIAIYFTPFDLRATRVNRWRSGEIPATRKIERLLCVEDLEQIVGIVGVIYWITVQEAIRFSDTIESYSPRNDGP